MVEATSFTMDLSYTGPEQRIDCDFIKGSLAPEFVRDGEREGERYYRGRTTETGSEVLNRKRSVEQEADSCILKVCPGYVYRHSCT